MSTTGEDVATATEPVQVHVSSPHGYSEDSDSSCTDFEVPPSELRHSAAKPEHTRLSTRTRRVTASKSDTATQKVRFSHSTEQRERTRLDGSATSSPSSAELEQSRVEVGNISSVQLKLGLDASVAQGRVNVLATLYQNYLRELKTAKPVVKEAPKIVTKKTGIATRSKPESSAKLSKVRVPNHRGYRYF